MNNLMGLPRLVYFLFFIGLVGSPVAVQHNVAAAQPLPALQQNGAVKIDSVGTGETSGHVLDLKIQNLTDQTINCVVGPAMLESKSRNNQDYVVPNPQTVTINPHGTTTVPINGVCINRNKPPIAKGAPGDLVVNTGDPALPQNPNSHIPVNQAGDLLRICTAKYNAADQLQKSGALKNLPYRDPQKQKDIVVQWSTWCDPRISEITGVPPATKEDLRKVVYKQVEEQGPMSPEKKKKVDQGIDTIFEKVELTTAKAKDLEKGVLLAPPAPEETAMQPTTPMPALTPTPSVRRRDEEELREFIDQQMPGAPRRTPRAIATATATPTLAPNERSLQDCLNAAKKKRDECKDEAQKRSDRCLDKCDKDFPKPESVQDQIQRGLCVNRCATSLLGEIGRCDANYAEALEDCIKKHLAEGQK
jgi:hypothetical protein